MGSINDRIVTDNVIDVLAAQYNALLGSIVKADWSNATTMSGTVTLTDSDYDLQRFDCNGANRIVKMPAYSTSNHPFFIINTTAATYTLDVQTNGGVSILTTQLAANGGNALIMPDGVAGFYLAGGTGIIPASGGIPGSPGVCDGRLTLTSGTPVTTSDVTAATTLYFTPYKGAKIGLYDGVSAWTILDFTELSLSLSGYTASRPYDIFIYNNSGTPAIESLIWTSDTARATALTTQDGILVKSGATTRRYVGTIRITSTTGQTEDSEKSRYVWNYYNRVPRILYCAESTSHTYTTASARAWNSNTTIGQGRFDFVVGWQEQPLFAEQSTYYTGTGTGQTTFGIDSVTGYSTVLTGVATASLTNTIAGRISASYLTVGYHYVQVIEYGNATSLTYYGMWCSAVIQA